MNDKIRRLHILLIASIIFFPVFSANAQTADTVPPTVSISSPANNINIAGVIQLTASASDNVGVTSVQFIVDGTNFGSAVTMAPYTVSLDTGTLINGPHIISATASDAAGNTATATPITINVVYSTATPAMSTPPATPDTTPPTVVITYPSNNGLVTGSVNIYATASDDTSIPSVQFTLDGTNLGSLVTASPYSLAWDTTTVANGQHTLAAIATDSSGNTSTFSIRVTTANSAPSTSTPSAAPASSSVAGEPNDGTLVKDAGSPAIYILEDGVKLPFASMDALTGLGYSLAQVQTTDTSSIPIGNPILTSSEQHPRGAVVVLNGTVYFIGTATKYPFPSAAVFESWGHTFQQVVPGNSFDNQLPTGAVVQLNQQ